MSLKKLVRLQPSLLLVALLAGCQTVLPVVLSAQPADHSVTLAVVQPRQVLAIGQGTIAVPSLQRNVLAALNHYTAVLWQFNGTSYVATTTTVNINPVAGAGLIFNHLASAKYQIHLTGRNASNAVITSDVVAAIDLTGNDVAASQTLSVLAPTMLDTPFSGTIHLPVMPTWATHLVGTLKAGSVVVQSISYATSATSHVDIKNIPATAVNYTLSLTASNNAGFSNTQTQDVGFAVTATTLNPEVSPVLTFVGPPPSITSVAPTFDSTAGGTTVTLRGTGFTGATAVTIGDAAATIAANPTPTDSSLTVTSPAHVVGATDVVVTIPAGRIASTAGAYTYVKSIIISKANGHYFGTPSTASVGANETFAIVTDNSIPVAPRTSVAYGNGSVSALPNPYTFIEKPSGAGMLSGTTYTWKVGTDVICTFQVL